jgi:hypothetical protein
LAAALKPYLLNPQILMAARRASLEKASAFDLNHALDDYEAVLKQATR